MVYTYYYFYDIYYYNYQYNKIRSAHRITYSVIVYIRIQLHITDSQYTLYYYYVTFSVPIYTTAI